MQTSYTRDPSRGLPGALAHGGRANIVTRFSEGLTSAGLYVVDGSGEGRVEVPSTAFTTGGAGIVHRSKIKELDGNGGQVFQDKEMLGVVDEGTVLVAYEPDTVPTPNTPAFARHTANGAGKTVLGAIRADADTANASQIPGGTFRKVYQEDGIVELELTGQI